MAHRIYGVCAPFNQVTMDGRKRGHKFRYTYESFGAWLHEAPKLDKHRVPVLFNHDENQVLAPPSAIKWRRGWVGLEYEAVLPDSPLVQRVLAEHRKKCCQVSLGFTIFAHDTEPDGTMLVTMGIILELSVVPMGAVPGTTFNVDYR